MFVNSRQIDTCTLAPLDVVQIGLFSIKAKASWKSLPAPPPVKPAPFEEEKPGELKAEKLAETVPETKEEEFPRVPVKSKEETPAQFAAKPDEEKPVFDVQETQDTPTSGQIETALFHKRVVAEEEDEDDEDEKAAFSLREKLLVSESLPPAKKQGKKCIEVFKTRNDTVLDLAFLDEKDRYLVPHAHGDFLLAHTRGSGDSYFYFTKSFSGTVNGEDGIRDLRALCTPENIFKKRKKIYNFKIPENGEVRLNDGQFDFTLKKAPETESFPVGSRPAKTADFFPLRNLGKSSIVHFVLLFLVWQVSLHQPLPLKKEVKDDSRFVKIDSALLKEFLKPPVQVKKKKTPVKKKIKKIRKKPKPVARVKTKPKVKPKPKPKPKPKIIAAKKTKQAPKPVKKPKKVKKKASVAAKKKMGSKAFQKLAARKAKKRRGGQEAVVSAFSLIEDIALQPAEALAAVTNLDAVVSSNDTAAAFKTGGIVEKLDTSGIKASSRPGVISTKGAAEVLGEYGNGGERVASLSGISSGQGEVRALVSAQMDRNVKVRGGMSREEVKKVIDKHLDEISYCYESALMSKPSLAGKMVSEWTILATGRVGEVNMKFSTVNSAEMHSCIRGAIKTWQFPKPRDAEVVVSYPFIFDVLGF